MIYICIMVLNKEEIKQLKIKLAMEGTGSKGKLADKLDLYTSQITLMCKTGFVPEHASKKLKRYIQ